MKTTTTTLAAIALALSFSALATPAAAKKKSILPPPEFDHPYVGTITVKRDSSASVPCRPRSLSTRLGCAFPPDKDGEECVIYLAYQGGRLFRELSMASRDCRL
jgi:hypothetical protein